ncbi:MAG: hypothetical protein II453_11165 [Alphaproteobacteria bacterium]|nr:hypothetical protein [Alphaproteobacteria bacterium]
MKATEAIKDIFKNYDTNVLNIADEGIDDGYLGITHVVLDGNQLLLYHANPDLLEDFQDDDYEQVYLEEDDDRWQEIKSAISRL